MRTQGWYRAVVAAALLVGGVALTPGEAGGQDPEACPQPYAPVGFARGYPYGEQPPTVDAIEVPQRPIAMGPPFDSDGDGTDDTVVGGSGPTTTITRGDGIVVLEATGATSVHAYGVGDIDGDGRDEIGVNVHEGTEEGTYLIPGTVAPGTQAIAAAGIGFTTPGSGLVDVGDGSGRLLSIQLHDGLTPPPNRTDVFDGPTVLALGPGGDGDAVTPTTTYDAQAALIADLGDPVATLVLARDLGVRSQGPIEVTVDRAGTTTRFTTVPRPYYPGPDPFFDGFTLLDGPGGTFLRLVQSSRGGSGTYLWSLTDPCTALAAAAPPPPAAPATPIDADAAFTG